MNTKITQRPHAVSIFIVSIASCWSQLLRVERDRDRTVSSHNIISPHHLHCLNRFVSSTRLQFIYERGHGDLIFTRIHSTDREQIMDLCVMTMLSTSKAAISSSSNSSNSLLLSLLRQCITKIAERLFGILRREDHEG
mmetsp:Transcript_13908/g.24429  ORF Transcript_13908/g.24429 Transcript_13908/m.24429 type:complete len:138 (+) Transcript_13908:487-900(+)